MKHDEVFSELQQCKIVDSYLFTRIIELKRNSVTNCQYSRKETIELNPVPVKIHEDVLEKIVYKALSPLGVNVVYEDLHTCHCTERLDRVTVKFKFRKQKQSLTHKRKNLRIKSWELTNLKLFERLLLSESVSHKNQRLAYECRQLKSARKTHSTWFLNNVLNVKLTEHGTIHKVCNGNEKFREVH